MVPETCFISHFLPTKTSLSRTFFFPHYNYFLTLLVLVGWGGLGRKNGGGREKRTASRWWRRNWKLKGINKIFQDHVPFSRKVIEAMWPWWSDKYRRGGHTLSINFHSPERSQTSRSRWSARWHIHSIIRKEDKIQSWNQVLFFFFFFFFRRSFVQLWFILRVW